VLTSHLVPSSTINIFPVAYHKRLIFLIDIRRSDRKIRIFKEFEHIIHQLLSLVFFVLLLLELQGVLPVQLGQTLLHFSFRISAIVLVSCILQIPLIDFPLLDDGVDLAKLRLVSRNVSSSHRLQLNNVLANPTEGVGELSGSNRSLQSLVTVANDEEPGAITPGAPVLLENDSSFAQPPEASLVDPAADRLLQHQNVFRQDPASLVFEELVVGGFEEEFRAAHLVVFVVLERGFTNLAGGLFAIAFGARRDRFAQVAEAVDEVFVRVANWVSGLADSRSFHHA
jgi:hypothetical protein